jgi:AraC family transcriptional regulator
LDNIALARRRVAPHELDVGALTVTMTQRGESTSLSDLACSLGRRDRPYPETHAGDWTIALVRRGAFTYRAGATNRRHPLRPGWLLVGAPGASFECSHDHDGGDDCTSLTLSRAMLEDASRVLGRDGAKLLTSAPALPPLPRVALLLERARRRNGADVDELGCLVAGSVLAQVSGAPLSRPVQSRSHVERVQAALHRIELRCDEQLTLPELARDASMSAFHFLRVFRQVTGTTPHQYVVGARLRLAARLLLDTKRSVTEIAYDVGFNDLSHFMRTFRRVVGETPRGYRRR